MTANDKQIERAAQHVMALAVARCIASATPLTVTEVRSEWHSWAQQTRHMAFQFQGSTSAAEPNIARVSVLLALLGFAVE